MIGHDGCYSCKSEYASRYLEPWKLLPRHCITASGPHNAAADGDGNDELHHRDNPHHEEKSQVLKLLAFAVLFLCIIHAVNFHCAVKSAEADTVC